MPSRVVSARDGAASKAPNRVAASAAGFPSLQIKILMAEFQFVARHQGVNDNGSANQRQWHEGQAAFRAAEILRRNRAHRRAVSSPPSHTPRTQTLSIPL